MRLVDHEEVLDLLHALRVPLIARDHGDVEGRHALVGDAAAQVGDSVRLVVIPGVGHFEIASPRTSTWPLVESAIRALLEGRLPPDSK